MYGKRDGWRECRENPNPQWRARPRPTPSRPTPTAAKECEGGTEPTISDDGLGSRAVDAYRYDPETGRMSDSSCGSDRAGTYMTIPTTENRERKPDVDSVMRVCSERNSPDGSNSRSPKRKPVVGIFLQIRPNRNLHDGSDNRESGTEVECRFHHISSCRFARGGTCMTIPTATRWIQNRMLESSCGSDRTGTHLTIPTTWDWSQNRMSDSSYKFELGETHLTIPTTEDQRQDRLSDSSCRFDQTGTCMTIPTTAAWSRRRIGSRTG